MSLSGHFNQERGSPAPHGIREPGGHPEKPREDWDDRGAVPRWRLCKNIF
jgi:hypothetical protein